MTPPLPPGPEFPAPPGWVDRRQLDALLDLLGARVDAADKALEVHVEQQIAALKDAQTRADMLERERIARVDERAKTLEVVTTERMERLDQALRALLPASDYERRHDELADRVRSLEEWRANLIGRAVGVAVIGALFVAGLAALFSHLLTT